MEQFPQNPPHGSHRLKTSCRLCKYGVWLTYIMQAKDPTVKALQFLKKRYIMNTSVKFINFIVTLVIKSCIFCGNNVRFF